MFSSIWWIPRLPVANQIIAVRLVEMPGIHVGTSLLLLSLCFDYLFFSSFPRRDFALVFTSEIYPNSLMFLLHPPLAVERPTEHHPSPAGEETPVFAKLHLTLDILHRDQLNLPNDDREIIWETHRKCLWLSNAGEYLLDGALYVCYI